MDDDDGDAKECADAWMPTSTCGTEFLLLPKQGEEHGQIVGPEYVSAIDSDQSGMRIISYGQYVRRHRRARLSTRIRMAHARAIPSDMLCPI